MSSEVIFSYLDGIFHKRNSIESSLSSVYYKNYVPTGFKNLPSHILIKIFRYLNEDELRKIALVCQRWRYAALKPELWKKLVFRRADNIPTNWICYQIKMFQHLKSIHLENVTEPNEILRQICRCSSDLQNISMRNCCGIKETSLRNLIKTCRMLVTLDLQGSNFKAKTFYLELASLEYLKRLNFNENVHFTVNNFLTVILNCALDELQTNRVSSKNDAKSVSDNNVNLMIANMSSTLKCLVLDASNLSNPTFESIYKCENLQSLGLHRATNLAGETFLKLWRNLMKVHQLTVTQANQIRGEHVASLFTEGFDVMKHLESLDFTGCWMVSDIGLIAVANCCLALKQLVLKGCKSLRNINSILRRCVELEHLNIAFCRNLDVESCEKVPRKLKVLCVDESAKFATFAEKFKGNKQTKIYLSLSEYNNDTRQYFG